MINTKLSKINYLVAIAGIGFLINCKSNSNYFEERKQFETEIIAALKLHILSKDTTYGLARLVAIGDTLIGYVPPSIQGDSEQYFFVENPSKSRKRKQFNNEQLLYPSISQIDDFKNGKLYFSAFGGSFMQSLSTAGELKTYFKRYENDVFYAHKVIIFKDKAVITSFSGVYVFDIESDKLIWTHTYRDAPDVGLSGVINGKLILTETRDKSITSIYCYDLQKNEVLWTKIVKSLPLLYNEEYRPQFYIDSYNGNIVLTMSDACYFLDPDSGFVLFKVSWKNYFEQFLINPKYNFLGPNMVLNRKTDIICKRIDNDKLLWELKGYYYQGLCNGKVVGVSKDMKVYAIINGISGKVEKLIKRPESKRMEFQFIGKYIFINHETICTE